MPTLAQLLRAGVTCARVDLSWGTKQYHEQSLANLQEAMHQTRLLCRYPSLLARAEADASTPCHQPLGQQRLPPLVSAGLPEAPLTSRRPLALPASPSLTAACGWTQLGGRWW